MNQGNQLGGHGTARSREPGPEAAWLWSADGAQGRLMALLRQVTGLDDVRLSSTEPGAMVMLNASKRPEATQRIVLLQRGESLKLYACPAELKSQAEALYRTSRAWHLTDWLARRADVWHARPNVHLAFRNSAGGQRLYLHCHLPVDEYVRRWSGGDFAQVGEHSSDEVRQRLWPWLRDRQYAAPEDDHDLDGFLGRLGRRPAHLRPGIKIRRFWPWAHAVEADERGMLASEVRAAITELLTALGQPLPPACTDGTWQPPG